MSAYYLFLTAMDFRKLESVYRRPRRVPRPWGVCASAGLIACGAFGCAPDPAAGGFDSPHPIGVLMATEDAARSYDRAAIPRLIEALYNDDPAVRFMSIHTLRRLTDGRTFGYRHDDPAWERNQAAQRWVQAGREGELGLEVQAALTAIGGDPRIADRQGNGP